MERLKVGQEILLINVKNRGTFIELEPIQKRTFVSTGKWSWLDGIQDIWCGSDSIGRLIDTEKYNTTPATKGKIVGRFTVRRLHNNNPITII